MADLDFKPANDTTQFGCYSERGLMSYFMFVVLPTQVGDFLADLKFPAGAINPFTALRGTKPKATIFSELHFGVEGFGCPDGAILIEAEKPQMVFIEVKANESYSQSCDRKNDYNSSIRGQLELRWRMTELHRSKCHQNHKKFTYVQETPEFKLVYRDFDKVFYGNKKRQNEAKLGSWRRLKIVEGVEKFLNLLALCEDRVYFCAVTKESTNPFDNDLYKHLYPRCESRDWSISKQHFCWLPIEDMVNAEPKLVV